MVKFLWKNEDRGEVGVSNPNLKWSVMFKKMNKWREQAIMTDFAIKIQENKVHCHKSVLAVHSDYFLLLFTCGMEDSQSSVITLNDYSLEVVKSVVEYMYTGSLQVSVHNVQELIMLADMWQVSFVKEACVVFLEKRIDPTNCIGILQFSEQYLSANPGVQDKSRKYLAKCFPQVVEDEDFPKLSYEVFKSVLSLDYLNLGENGEDTVLKAAFKWLRHSETNAKYTTDILDQVRLKLVSKETLDDCKQYFNTNELEEYLTGRLDSEREESPRRSEKFVYVIGGYIQSRTGPLCPRTSSLERFNLCSNKWETFGDDMHRLPETPFLASYTFAFNIGNRLLCYLSQRTANTNDRNYGIWEYDPVSNAWKSHNQIFPESQKLFIETAAGNIDQCIMNGGNVVHMQRTNKNVEGASAEPFWLYEIYTVCNIECNLIRLNEDDGELTVSKLSSNVRQPAKFLQRKDFALVHKDECLYLIGGSIVESQRDMRSVNCVYVMEVGKFDQGPDRWVKKCSMNEARAQCSAVVHEDYIYAIGGFSQLRLKSCERYDPEANQWTMLTAMNKHRTHAVAVSTSCGILICGGKSYSANCGGARKVLKTSEMYNPYEDTWTFTEPMLTARCMFTAVVL